MELEAAIAQILAALPPAQPEEIPLSEAHGRFLAREIFSTLDLPPFDNSAMDGYAVRSLDLHNAAAGSPVALQLAGRVAAGEPSAAEVSAGACVRIFTGSPLPGGADAVVMQEETQVEAADPAKIWFQEPVKPWENVRFKGEDIKTGSLMGAVGAEVTAGRLGLLGATGWPRIWAGRRPRVGLLATGSELVEAGQPLESGKIYESNRATLAALIQSAGGLPTIYPLVKDSLAETGAALETAFGENDLVVTSGGVSVGEMDFIKSAFAALGGKLEFWRINLRPGRPFLFGHYKSKFLFGLPGNPVSAFITFLLLVRPALRRWQGAAETIAPVFPATLGEPLANHSTRRHFMRVTVDSQGTAHAAGGQASHLLSALAEANGLVDVPPQTTLPPGSPVKIIHWQ